MKPSGCIANSSRYGRANRSHRACADAPSEAGKPRLPSTERSIRLVAACIQAGFRIGSSTLAIAACSLAFKVTAPLVVLSSGGGVPGVDAWDAIEALLARCATVLTYDRKGLGRSDPPPEAPTAAHMVSDLHALLNALKISTPVILVGRSLGALPVQLYACEYPSQVTGLVLLDPTPDQLLAGYHAPILGRQSYPPRVSPNPYAELSHIERERMTESCAQVRCAIEEQRRMPDRRNNQIDRRFTSVTAYACARIFMSFPKGSRT
jgi:pimeloyl-ACP methyl ester carboxylesterase